MGSVGKRGGNDELHATQRSYNTKVDKCTSDVDRGPPEYRARESLTLQERVGQVFITHPTSTVCLLGLTELALKG